MSGLFGNLSNPSQTSSLFGSTPASQPTSSLFNTPAPTTTTTSLFGNAGATQQPTNQQTQQTGGAGLFGNLASNQSQQTQQVGGGGLFGNPGSNLQAQNQQTQGAGGGGLFGNPGPTTQPSTLAGGGLFAGAGSTQGQQQPQGASTTVGAPQQQQQNGGLQSQNTYFDTILERSRKRALGESSDGDTPQLQLGLGDLRARIKRLATTKQDQSVDGKAHYLLAASGVDPGAAVRDLQQFSTIAGKSFRYQPQDSDNDTDIEGYLANVQTQTTLSMISDGLARSVRDFNTFLEDNVTMEWEAQRKRIYEHFGIKPKESTVGGGSSSFAPSASESQGSFGRSRKSKAGSLAGSRVAGKTTARDSGRFTGYKSVIGSAGPISNSQQPLFADVEKSMEANGIMASGSNDRYQRERQGRLAEKVQHLNEARLKKRCYHILHEFAAAVKLSAETHSEKVAAAYGALIEIIQENPELENQSDPGAVKERQFAAAYLDASQESLQSQNVRSMILRGSARFLEKQFFQNVESSLSKAPREANLGGVPDVLSKIKAFVRLKAARRDFGASIGDMQLDHDDIVWPIVYFLLRSGHVQEASRYVQKTKAFELVDRNFTRYIKEYADSANRVLSPESSSRITNEYNQRSKVAPENSVDPYRMACYKIVGRCEITNRSLNSISQDMDDFMWLQFAMARETKTTDAFANEVCTLATVQSTIKEVGARYFTKNKDVDFATYFFLLTLGGMFEDAVAYLAQFAPTDAVHVAIAVDYYGLLRVSDPNAAENDLLSHTTTELPQIDFGRMVGYYTRDFRAANVVAAADYLCLICLNQDLPGEAGLKQVALCHEALRELVLESREFALLLGDITTEGGRISGAIESRQQLIALGNSKEFMRIITMQAASIADDNGRTTDAVLLYHLAEEYDTVVVIISRALSEVINTPLGQQQYRLQPLIPRAATSSSQPQGSSFSLMSIDDPYALAEAIAKIYGEHSYSSNVKAATMTDFKILMELCRAKALVDQQQWTEALDIIKQHDLLPLEVHGNAAMIRTSATRFSSLSQPIANSIPNVLLWAVTCGSRKRKELMNAQFGGNEGTRKMMIESLQQQNMDLTMYTSQLRYRFPAALHEALAAAQSQ